MAAKITIADKQYLAKILYTREQLDGKVVAKRVGVSEKTISTWVNNFNWKNLRKRLLISKEEQINNLYEQLEELNNTIRLKDKGSRFATNKEADTLIKLTAALRNLITDLAIADLVESGIQFIKFMQKTSDMEQVIEVSDLWNSFLQFSIKK